METSTQVRVAFDDVGDGDPACLLLPGWCANRTVFRDLLAPIARRRRAVAVDWRGHGGSEIPDDDYGTEELVEDAVAVIDRAGLHRVVPVALAHAGWVAIELRRRLGPQRVPGIVLLDWMVLGPPPGFLDALTGLQDPERWIDVRAGLLQMWTTGVDLPALDAHLAAMADYGYHAWARGGREIAARFDSEGTPAMALERLDPPCATFHIYAQPAGDDVLAAQEAYAAAHPWFTVRRLPASSHFPMFEVPELLASAVEGFVSGLA